MIKPDYEFFGIRDIPEDFFEKEGIEYLLIDIDNTLEPYENAIPSQKVIEWLDSLKDAGIKTAIVSNNNEKRVCEFNQNTGMPAYSRSGKPFKKNVLNAIADMGIKKEEAILMGDQIFTDVWAAHNAGIPAILVSPIKDRRDLLTKLKRLLERPVLYLYGKKTGSKR